MLPRAPFMGFVMFFICGIIFSRWTISFCPDHYNILFYIETVVIVLVAAVFYWLSKKRRRQTSGVLFSLLLFILGVYGLHLHYARLESDLKMIMDNPVKAYVCQVRTLPEKRTKTLRVEAMISQLKIGGNWNQAHISVLLSIPLESDFVPAIGETIMVYGKPDRPRGALNPAEFDYQTYLWHKGIVWTDYLSEGSAVVISSKNRSPNLLSRVFSVSEWSDKQFKRYLKDAKSYGLVKAMLLGRRDDLRADQVGDYVASGTVHILSVSGMHVAMIFLVLSQLLGWVKKLKGGPVFYLLLITAMLCFYAVLTGLSASVQRATLMCIVFVLAEVFSRRYNNMNTLALSALLILLIEPQALFDLRFQLSYMAMTGIFLFYRPLYSVYRPGNKILKYIWQIVALSFAAQVTTFPLTLFYFHQFPTYFWLVNPFVITFTNLLVPAAMLLLLVCLLPFYKLSAFVGWFVDLFSGLTNISASFTKQLPGYLVENIYLDGFEVVIFYIVLLCFWIAYAKQSARWITAASLAAFLLTLYSISTCFQAYLVPRAMVHAVPKHQVISFKEGDKLYLLADESFAQDTTAYLFYIKNYAVTSGTLTAVFIKSDISGQNFAVKNMGKGKVICWQHKVIFDGRQVSANWHPDYSIPGGFKKQELTNIYAKSDLVFLDGRMNERTRVRFGGILKRNSIKTYDLFKEGAFLLP